jgi:hypothetical protein
MELRVPRNLLDPEVFIGVECPIRKIAGRVLDSK